MGGTDEDSELGKGSPPPVENLSCPQTDSLAGPVRPYSSLCPPIQPVLIADSPTLLTRSSSYFKHHSPSGHHLKSAKTGNTLYPFKPDRRCNERGKMGQEMSKPVVSRPCPCHGDQELMDLGTPPSPPSSPPMNLWISADCAISYGMNLEFKAKLIHDVESLEKTLATLDVAAKTTYNNPNTLTEASLKRLPTGDDSSMDDSDTGSETVTPGSTKSEATVTTVTKSDAAAPDHIYRLHRFRCTRCANDRDRCLRCAHIMQRYMTAQYYTHFLLGGERGTVPKRPAFAIPEPGVPFCVVCGQIIPFSLQGPQWSLNSRCSSGCDEYFFQGYSYSVRDFAYPSPEARLLWPNRFMWTPPDRARLAAPGRWVLWDLVHVGTAGRQLSVIWTPAHLRRGGFVYNNFEHCLPLRRKKPTEEWTAGGGSLDPSLSSVREEGLELKVWYPLHPHPPLD